jgi:hypothetical protein
MTGHYLHILYFWFHALTFVVYVYLHWRLPP